MWRSHTIKGTRKVTIVSLFSVRTSSSFCLRRLTASARPLLRLDLVQLNKSIMGKERWASAYWAKVPKTQLERNKRQCFNVSYQVFIRHNAWNSDCSVQVLKFVSSGLIRFFPLSDGENRLCSGNPCASSQTYLPNLWSVFDFVPVSIFIITMEQMFL